MLDHEPIFGKNVIETLSEGMYDNPLFLFREYVQNAADAIDDAVRQGVLCAGQGQIEITIDAENRLITFEDNGTGIPHDAVKVMLANIGDSQKDRKTDKGFRGIGRLGGLGYCQNVRFETSVQGEKVKSVLEWDARNLHEILANKDEKIHAGQLIKRITSTWEEKIGEQEHFFKVSLVNVNISSDELLDKEEVRKYLSMVAPVPFDYAKFPFIRKIEKFISDEQLPALHEYCLFLNGDEIRKGYVTPLGIGEGKAPVEVLDVMCQTISVEDELLGWYWFCVSKFEGALPVKCWQRGLRLRKANIQIGESDCLTNHPRNKQQRLWKEDRGNNYFLGEIHAIDEDLIPNSRRDYFNQNDACRRFEKALKEEFSSLHSLYRSASEIRSAYSAVRLAGELKVAYEKRHRRGELLDSVYRDQEEQKVVDAVKKAKMAQRKLEKFESKVLRSHADLDEESETSPPVATVLESYKGNESIIAASIESGLPSVKRYPKDGIRRSVRNVLDDVFSVLSKMLPEEQAAPIRNAIIKRFSRK